MPTGLLALRPFVLFTLFMLFMQGALFTIFTQGASLPSWCPISFRMI